MTDLTFRQRGSPTETKQQLSENLRTESNIWSQVLPWHTDWPTVSCNVTSTSTFPCSQEPAVGPCPKPDKSTAHNRESHLNFIYLTLFIQIVHPTPRTFLPIRNKIISYGEMSIAHAQQSSCRTTHCRLSAAAYSIYWQLEAVSCVHNLRTRHTVATRDPYNVGCLSQDMQTAREECLHPLVREGAIHQEPSNCKAEKKNLVLVPDGSPTPRQTGRMTVGRNLTSNSSSMLTSTSALRDVNVLSYSFCWHIA
jgi:hypothetical protein